MSFEFFLISFLPPFPARFDSLLLGCSPHFIYSFLWLFRFIFRLRSFACLAAPFLRPSSVSIPSLLLFPSRCFPPFILSFLSFGCVRLLLSSCVVCLPSSPFLRRLPPSDSIPSVLLSLFICSFLWLFRFIFRLGSLACLPSPFLRRLPSFLPCSCVVGPFSFPVPASFAFFPSDPFPPPLVCSFLRLFRFLPGLHLFHSTFSLLLRLFLFPFVFLLLIRYFSCVLRCAWLN